MLQYAAISTVVRTILIIVLVWYGVKILSRMFAPLLMRYVAKKAEQKFGQKFNQHQQSKQPKKKEGETSIDKVPNEKGSSNKNVGEYVDYEEID